MITEELKTFINKIPHKTIAKWLMLVAPIVLAVTIIFPVQAYALSIREPTPPPSESVKSLLNLLLLLIIVLFTTFLIISALLSKSKKSKSGQKSKFPRLVLKVLLIIGALLFISSLSLQIGDIRDLIDRNYYASTFSYPYYPLYTDSVTITQKIVVGFKKGVSQEKAEEYLKNEKVEFTKTGDINAGKIFFYNTGLKYITTVPFSDTDNQIANFKSSPLVYDALRYSNNPNEIID